MYHVFENAIKRSDIRIEVAASKFNPHIIKSAHNHM